MFNYICFALWFYCTMYKFPEERVPHFFPLKFYKGFTVTCQAVPVSLRAQPLLGTTCEALVSVSSRLLFTDAREQPFDWPYVSIQ